MLGFLYRATVGSAVNVLRGRLSVRHLMTNWIAAAKLPFVYMGLVEDFWNGFDRYSRAGGWPPFDVLRHTVCRPRW
jgi:hypothetical protein